MVAVNLNTIRTDSWNQVYNYLQTTNPISTNNIFSSLNSKLIKDVGYPFVIIAPPKVSFNKFSLGCKLKQSEVNMFIEIYHTSSESAKTLTDDVTAKLLAGISIFSVNGLTNMQIDSGDYDPWQDGNKKIHRYSFNITFRVIQ